MAKFYEASDWHTLYFLMGEINAWMETREMTGKANAMLLASLLGQLSSLGLTEGDRRRMRIELDKPDDVAGGTVTSFEQHYKNKLKEASEKLA